MSTVIINGKEYKIVLNLRAMFAFERITGKNYDIKTLQDQYVLFYCCLIAADPELKLDFGQFIDECDNDLKSLAKFTAYLDEYNKKYAVFYDEEQESKKVNP